MLLLFFATESLQSCCCLCAPCFRRETGKWRAAASPRGEREKRDQKGATRWIMSVLPCPPNSYCYRLGNKECGSCELRKSTEKPLSTFPALHTGLWFAFHCLLLLEKSESLCCPSAQNKAVHIFAAREWSISSYMKRTDRKLWGDTCHKINQQSYAHHSFQSWQVTPPARITEYIYNSSIA